MKMCQHLGRCPWSWAGALAAVVLITSTTMADEGQKDTAEKDKPDAARRAAHLLKQLDANDDGEITADEVADEKSRLFQRLVRTADANDDGKINASELLAGIAPADDSIKNAAFGPGERGRRPGADGGRPGPEQMFAHADANDDGKLDADEMVAAHRKRIERMIERADTDGDGALDREEFAKVAAHMRQGAEGRRGRPEAKQAADKKKADGKKKSDGKKKGKQAGEKPGKPDRKRPDIARRPGGPDGPPRGRRPGGPDGPPRGFGGRPGGPPRIEIFVVIDTNKDGKLSKEEVSAAADAIAGLDKNDDGEIDMPEAMGHRPGGDQFARRSDGPPQRRGREDVRRPGGRRGPPEGRRGRPEGRGREGRGRDDRRGGPSGEGFSPEHIVERVMQADANGDGKISRDEAPERLKTRFDDVDANGDDVVDQEELGRMIGERMRQFRERGGEGRRGPDGREREGRGRGSRGPRGEGRPQRPAAEDDTAATDIPADAV